MADLVRTVVIVWCEGRTDKSEFPIKSYEVIGDSISLYFADDLLKPGVKSKTLIVPMSRVHSVEITETVEQKSEGYREPNKFREIPGTAPHVPGGKLP